MFGGKAKQKTYCVRVASRVAYRGRCLRRSAQNYSVAHSRAITELVSDRGSAGSCRGLRQRLLRIPLDVLERETGLSRHSIVRVRKGKRVHPRTVELLVRRYRTS